MSTGEGRIAVEWELHESGLQLVWQERGGPPVAAPAKRGFGALVIEHNLVRALNADVNWRFESAGLRCEIDIPRAHFASR